MSKITEIPKARSVTVREFIEAMRKNGYEQARNGEYINYDYVGGKAVRVSSACAYGQAALNLGCTPDDLHVSHINGFPNIVALNDRDGYSIQEIADEVENWALATNSLSVILAYIGY